MSAGRVLLLVKSRCLGTRRGFAALGRAEAVAYEHHGQPSQVLRKVEMPPEVPLKSDEVLVRMLAAPINPADLNVIEGTYGILPDLPAVGGHEGVGQVIEVGEDISSDDLAGGDWVLPSPLAKWGTWRTHVVARRSELLQIPTDIPLLSAATLKVAGATAFRMLNDFVHLQPGDLVIQNAANSAVGQAVAQICASMAVSSVNIVRERESEEENEATKAILKSCGASHVITDTYLGGREMREFMSNKPAPKLALNGVGGKILTDMVRYLAPGATVVTYGGMSRKPITLSTSSFIFKDLIARGFWMTRWYQERAEGRMEEVEEMYARLVEMVRRGELSPPHSNLVPLSRWEEALEGALESRSNVKQVIFMEQYDTD